MSLTLIVHPSSPLIYLLTPEIVGRHRSKY
jgi:hypothetical protein